MDQVNDKVCNLYFYSYIDRQQCPFSSLVYSQWLNGTVLETISENLSDQVTSYGYVLNYADYVNSAWITPEDGFWKDSNDIQQVSSSEFEDAMWWTYLGMNAWVFFNPVELAKYIIEPSEIPSLLPSMDRYVR